MQLRDRGLLSLDDPAVKYVPELREVHNPYGDISQVTIRHLMTHSAGFRAGTWPWGGDQPWHPFEPTRWAQVVAMMPYTELQFRPGTKYSYSNPGVIFLGRIIELFSGDDYEVYINKNIFMPLGMTRSFFDRAPYHLVDSPIAQLRRRPTRASKEQRFDFDSGITVSNGGLNAPLGDMAKYLAFLIDGNDTILKRSSLDEMFTPQIRAARRRGRQRRRRAGRAVVLHRTARRRRAGRPQRRPERVHRRQAAHNNVMVALAAISFVAIFFYDVPFPVIVFGAGIIGYVAGRAGLEPFLAGGGHGKVGAKQVADRELLLGEETPDHAKPNLRWSLSIAAVFLALWLVPVAVLYLALGGDNVFTKIAIFFSQMAVVTFGGAYAVLAYVAQQAVEHYHWVKPGEMLDGLGMAETTPGPLIMVTQFVGFLAAWREPGGMPPLLAATLGGLLTTWVTFTPCFLWIFFGAPFVEALRSNKALECGAGRHHRRCRGRDPEPCRMVRACTCCLPRSCR